MIDHAAGEHNHPSIFPASHSTSSPSASYRKYRNDMKVHGYLDCRCYLQVPEELNALRQHDVYWYRQH